MQLNDLEPEVQELLLEITNEMAHSILVHGNFHSAHEAYAVLLEEVDEFWDEVKKKQHNKYAVKEKQYNKYAMKGELIQVAAVCLKTIEFLEAHYD